MRKFGMLWLILGLSVVAVLQQGCETTTGPSAVFVPRPPEALYATSIDSATIAVKWDHSPDRTVAEFSGYAIKLTDPNGVVMLDTVVPASWTQVQVTGLQEGKVYTCQVAGATADTVGPAKTIEWSPASRFVELTTGNPVRMYESASIFGSGLDLYDPNEGGPVNLKTSSGQNWDLGLYTRDNKLIIASPTLLKQYYTSLPDNLRATQIAAEVYTNVNSLDEVFDSEALSAKSFAEREVDLSQYNGNIVLVVKTADNHYAKVLVKYVNGSFLQGSEPNRYVECEVSYQKEAGVPYARTARNHNSGVGQ